MTIFKIKEKKTNNELVVTFSLNIFRDGDLVLTATNNRGEQKNILWIDSDGKLNRSHEAGMAGIATDEDNDGKIIDVG